MRLSPYLHYYGFTLLVAMRLVPYLHYYVFTLLVAMRLVPCIIMGFTWQ